MVRLLTLGIMVFFLTPALAAADWSAADISAGPSYMRIVGQDLAGGQVGIAVNHWKHVSLIGTFAYHQGNQKTFRFGPPAHPPGRCDNDPTHVSDHDRDNDNTCPLPGPVFITTGIGDVYTYLGGLRVRKSAGRFGVFVQTQAGGVHVGDENGLAIAAGGGVQVSISQRYAVEARVEYLPMRLAGAWLDDNVQTTVGVVVRFGPWWGGYRKP